MKDILTLILLMVLQSASSQKRTSIIELSNNVTITGVIEKFEPGKHKLDTCTDDFNNRYICKIDNKKWFGSDQSLEIPRNQLLSLKIKIGNKEISLNTSGMFNPAFEFQLSQKQFKIKKITDGYILYSFFSDGAGTYTVHWKINNNKSKRILVSVDEKDFSWQFDK